MISLLETFQSSRSRTAWIGSVSYGFIMIFGPISGKLLQKYGAIKVAIFGALVVMLGVICSSYAGDIRVLFLTHGILVGVGSSFASTPGLIMVSLYFTTKRSFATGIVMAGGAAGTLVQNQVHRYLINAFGWRTSLRVYCGILTICIFAGFAYRPLEKRRHPSVVENFQTSPLRGFIVDLSLWKDSIFELWVCALGLAKFGFFIPFVHMMKLAGDLGISLDDASYIMVGIGMSSLLSCLLFGKICDLENINRLYVNQASVLSVGLLYLTIPLCTTFPSLVAFGSLLGFFDAGNYVLLPVLTLDLMGAEKMPVAWGFMMAVHTISCFGPPFAGLECWEIGYISSSLASEVENTSGDQTANLKKRDRGAADLNMKFVVEKELERWLVCVVTYTLGTEHEEAKSIGVNQQTLLAKIFCSQTQGTHEHLHGIWIGTLHLKELQLLYKSLNDSYTKYSSVWTSRADLPKVEDTTVASPVESTAKVEQVLLEEGEASDSKKEAYVVFVDVEHREDEELHDEGTTKVEKVPFEEDEVSDSKKAACVAFIDVEQHEDKDLLDEGTAKVEEVPLEEGETSGTKKETRVTFVDVEHREDEDLSDEDAAKVEEISLEEGEASGSKKETHVTFVDVEHREDEDLSDEDAAKVEEISLEEGEASGSKKETHVTFVDVEHREDEDLSDEDAAKVEEISLEEGEASGSKKETHVTFVDVEHREDEDLCDEGTAKTEVPLEKGETSGSKKETHVTFVDVEHREDEDLHDEGIGKVEEIPFEEGDASGSKKAAHVAFVDAEQHEDEDLHDDEQK
ncbi:Monocarboxylate transporter 10 [Chelonia mydas]|uniref:Monocarboxylate transporter 10 n=1 Tax=Chelonia mydas TaxID=8469 RepID=M7AJB2_CHEMY|nr:Monocarboxylate transporter 10 [Chelonia mydas]